MEMMDTSGHATNVAAAVAAVNPWVLTITSELQLLLALLGVVWLSLQITLKILSLRKPK